MAAVEPPPPPLAFHLPPLSALSFAPLLFLLCLLLQPAVPTTFSRVARLALLVPTAWLAWSSSFRYRIEPAELGIGANFRWGIFSPYFLMKTLEWALASGRAQERERAWIGFDGKAEEKLHSSEGHRKEDVQAAEKGAKGTATAGGDLSQLRQRSNGVPLVAPQPIHPSPASSLAPPSASSSSTASTPQQLPTPSPSPPFSAVQPPSLAESATPSARLTPLTTSKSSALRTEQRHHPLRVLADAAHLLTAMRGVGYAWGPPLRSLAKPAPSHGAFLQRAAGEFALAHAVGTGGLALQVLHRDGQLAPLFLRVVPFLPAAVAEEAAGLTARLLVGVTLYYQMLIGFSGANVLFLLLAHLTNSVLDRLLPARWGWTWRAVFDTREYPPLFDAPFERMGEGGVSGFWGKRWHALFRSSFTAIGFLPAVRLSRRLGLPNAAGKLLGAVVVFGLSAWMHWQALFSARYSLAPTPSALSFAALHSLPLSSLYPAPWSALSLIERHGTWVFFLAQPLAVVLESAWTARTRRRIGGVAGRVWTAMWVVGLGQAVVGRSWLALGLAHGLPPVAMWSWHRWLLPTFCLAPMPAFMRFPSSA
ncbi:hypothetical protein JCM8097_008954 [Rhodosporidiobolus ruineniae]